MTIARTFGQAAREIWIGPVYLGRLRECKSVNRETGEIRHFLAADADGVPVYRTVTYGQEL